MCEEYCDSGQKAIDDAAMTYAKAADCLHTFHMMTIKYIGMDTTDEHLMHYVRMQYDRVLKVLTEGPTEGDLLEMAVNEATREVIFDDSAFPEEGPDVDE